MKLTKNMDECIAKVMFDIKHSFIFFYRNYGFPITFDGWSSNKAVRLLRWGVEAPSITVNIVFDIRSRSEMVPVFDVSSLDVTKLGEFGDEEVSDEGWVTPEHIDNRTLLLSSVDECCTGDMDSVVLFLVNSLLDIE